VSSDSCIRYEVVQVVRRFAEDEVHVTAPPAVYGLLGIAHHQHFTALAKQVQYEWQQVVPLLGRSILEFIDQYMPETGANLFIDKRGIFIGHQAAEQTQRVTDHQGILLLSILPDIALHPPKYTQVI
jgi:hypothetical protein